MESQMRRQYKSFQSLDDQIYLVAEAKFVAEAVLGIWPKDGNGSDALGW